MKITIKEEEKRRIETMKALRSWYEDKFGTWRTEIEVPVYKKIDECAVQMVGFAARIDKIEAEMEVDRKAVQKAVETAVESLSSQLEEFKAKYKAGELERDRKEEEARKLQEENLHKMQKLFAIERKEREASLDALRKEITHECDERRSAIEVVKEQNVAQIVLVKQAVQIETKARSAVQEELVQQINHYAAALQDAIKNMM